VTLKKSELVPFSYDVDASYFRGWLEGVSPYFLRLLSSLSPQLPFEKTGQRLTHASGAKSAFSGEEQKGHTR